jgi:hypothetical protein
LQNIPDDDYFRNYAERVAAWMVINSELLVSEEDLR